MSETLLTKLAKAALDINTYAVHDGECWINYDPRGAQCDCGYSKANRRVIDLADQVVKLTAPTTPESKP